MPRLELENKTSLHVKATTMSRDDGEQVTNHPNKKLEEDSWFDMSCLGHQSLQCFPIFIL